MNNLSILVATDYSEAAKTAEHYATKFAAHTNSFINFLHVYDLSSANKGSATESAKIKIELHDSKLEQLQLHCGELINANGGKKVNYECHVHSGKIGKTIATEANDIEPDILFMGTHGKETFREALFGGHTWEMIKKRNVPVLAIPSGSEFKNLKHFVFAAQGREGEIPALKYVASLAAMFDAEITILHINDYMLSTETESELFKKFERKVEKEILYPKKMFRLWHAKEVAKGINEFCENFHVDWVILCPEKTGFFEKIFMPDVSITRKMSFVTTTPMLSIPDYYDPVNFKIRKIVEPGSRELNDRVK